MRGRELTREVVTRREDRELLERASDGLMVYEKKGLMGGVKRVC